MISASAPPMGTPCSPRWTTPEYADEMRAFVEGAVGPVELHREKVRPWSTVWRAVVVEDRASYWAKENCPSSRFEARLLDVLNTLVPDRVVPLTALDAERGLLMTPDQGDVLGFGDADLERWARIVREWSLLQRELVPHADRLRATGLPELAVSDYLRFLDERVEALRALPEGDVRRLPARAADRILQARPVVEEAIEVVGALGLPSCLTHHDLHGANVFARVGDEPLRFFDLGDAMLTHPATDLLTPVGCLSDVLGCGRDDPRLHQVAEAWVEVWSDAAPAGALRAALPFALRLARLPRHETWLRMTPGMTDAEAEEWGPAGSEYLGALPDPPLLSAT